MNQHTKPLPLPPPPPLPFINILFQIIQAILFQVVLVNFFQLRTSDITVFFFYNFETKHPVNIKRHIWLYDKGNYDTLRNDGDCNKREWVKERQI